MPGPAVRSTTGGVTPIAAPDVERNAGSTVTVQVERGASAPSISKVYVFGSDQRP